MSDKTRTPEEIRDERIADAINIMYDYNMASISLIQRKMQIGYNRAFKIFDQLEQARIVGEFTGLAPRKLLKTREEALKWVLNE